MCGINGFSWPDATGLRRMNAAIAHRGPDDEGSYADASVSLGHVRLSIIDLSPAGHQPMFYSKTEGACSATFHKQLCKQAMVGMVFNGEIYNYVELREQLKELGYTFTTASDTEVILASYLEWGADCVQKFNGMWAFCIYDKNERLLFCSRDRLGVKPFHYYHHNGKFIFSSELKGIFTHKTLRINTKNNINQHAISFYYGLGFIPAPHTIFNNVAKLEAGHNLFFDLRTKKCVTKKYYVLPDYSPLYNKRKLLREGRALLEDAVRLRMRSDVPVGAFLSGGLDSTSIVATMEHYTHRQLHTFSVGFDGVYDETPAIKLAAHELGTKHTHVMFTEKDAMNNLKLSQQLFDEPHADFGFLPTIHIARVARKDITVALTGDGGDEIFGGYSSYTNLVLYEKTRMIPRFLRRALFNMVNLFKRTSDLTLSGKKRELLRWSLESDPAVPLLSLYPGQRFWTPEAKQFYVEKHRLLAKNKTYNLIERERLYDLLYNTLADNFLVKTDRSTMSVALEARNPYLDYRFIELSMRLPTKWKAGLFKTKPFMRSMVSDRVPRSLTNLPKKGFSPPFREYLFSGKHDEFINKLCQQLAKQRILPPSLFSELEARMQRETFTTYDDFIMKSVLLALWSQKWLA